MSATPFGLLSAIAAPLMRDNVNTDAIIPSREMKTVGRKGLADGLFADWRYTSVGGRDVDPGFVLNRQRYTGAQILLAGENFGCGSSREHAAWALAEYGFRAIVAESFNPIFRNNAVLNAMVPVILTRGCIEALARQVETGPFGRPVTVDLDAMVVAAPDGERFAFALDGEARAMLRDGLDGIDLTLIHADAMDAFCVADRRARPWAYVTE